MRTPLIAAAAAALKDVFQLVRDADAKKVRFNIETKSR